MSNARKYYSIFVEALNIPFHAFRVTDMQQVIDQTLTAIVLNNRMLGFDSDSDDEFEGHIEPLLRVNP
jgi:hypothetical protein